VTPGVDEVSLYVVLSAGEGWPEEIGDVRDLVVACAEVEREVREREWAALERLLAHVDDDRVIPPREPQARVELVAAIDALGWCRRAPGAIEGLAP
jgi:hypothetical protein